MKYYYERIEIAYFSPFPAQRPLSSYSIALFGGNDVVDMS
jgi:hypothetical protein